MLPRLIANESVPAPSVVLLRAHGVDVLAIAESYRSIGDAEVMRLAREQKRWLVTYDRDYGTLVFERGLPPPPPILLFRQEPFPATRAANLLLPLLETPGDIEGYFVVVGERTVCRHPLSD